MSEIKFSLPTTELVIIRPMKLNDIPLLCAMHDRLSKESIYSRYFSVNKPSMTSLVEQAHLSSCRGASYVAVLQNPPYEIIGVAYYICSSDDFGVAEPALLIEDRFQGNGLGWMMMEQLISTAREQAISVFQSYVLMTNQRILRILEKSGLPLGRHYRDGLFEIRLNLCAPPNILNKESAELPAGYIEQAPVILVGA